LTENFSKYTFFFFHHEKNKSFVLLTIVIMLYATFAFRKITCKHHILPVLNL